MKMDDARGSPIFRKPPFDVTVCYFSSGPSADVSSDEPKHMA